MGAVISYWSELEVMAACPTCGIPFAAPSNFVRCRREDQQSFYCPNGHSQSFRDGEVARLRKKVEETERRLQSEKIRRETVERDRDRARHAEAVVSGKLKAIKQRVKNGVCPCCKRSFENLQRHMATKHPDFATGNEKEPAA